MVIWLIGLSGSGKTTFSTALYNLIKPYVPNLVRVDGDLVRDMFKNDVDHSIEGREKNAHRISHLTKYLSDQNIHVIAAVLSNFPVWQKWNRNNIKNYKEIYLKSSMETLFKRDNKNLYKSALSGQTNNVVGIDIPFQEPKNPDIIIENEIEHNKEKILNNIINLSFVKNYKEWN